MVDWKRIDGTTIPSGTATAPGALEKQTGFIGQQGTMDTTLSPFVMSASGKVQITGTMGVTLSDFSMVAYETAPSGDTETRLSLDGYGVRPAGDFVGKTLNESEPGIGLTRLSLDGYGARREGLFTNRGVVFGTLETTLSAFTMTASGVSGAQGTLATTLSSFLMTADGKVLISGTMDTTLSSFTMAFSGPVPSESGTGILLGAKRKGYKLAHFAPYNRKIRRLSLKEIEEAQRRLRREAIKAPKKIISLEKQSRELLTLSKDMLRVQRDFEKYQVISEKTRDISQQIAEEEELLVILAEAA